MTKVIDKETSVIVCRQCSGMISDGMNLCKCCEVRLQNSAMPHVTRSGASDRVVEYGPAV